MKKILIVGAGFLQDFVIRRAVEDGFETLAIDANPNAVGFTHASKHAVINIVDEKACLEYAESENIDGVLTAATDFGVLTAAYIAREMGLPGLNYDSASLVKNKYHLRKCFFENRIDDSDQAYEVNADTNIHQIANQLKYPVMVKPCDGSGSRGASRVNSPDELEKACMYAISSSYSRSAEIESFIKGHEYGAESLVVDGEVHVLGIMKKWMTNPPSYAELGHALPCGLPYWIEKKARSLIERAIHALGINHGSVNMDMIITEDGKVHIIDVGARMGGNLIGPFIIPYGTGIDYVGNVIKNAVGEPLDWSVKEKRPVATRLLAFDNGTINAIPDISSLEKEYNVEIFHHMETGMKVNEYQTNLDGLGYVVATDNELTKAINNAEAVVNIFKKKCFQS